MRQPEFVNECRRLYGGCNADVQLTPERLHVLWGLYGNLDGEVWSKAMDLGLLDHRIPNATGFERLVDRAEQLVEKRRAIQHNADAANWPAKIERSASRSSLDVARSAISAIREMTAASRPWIAIEPWWERCGQTGSGLDYWRLNENRSAAGLPAGPPWPVPVEYAPRCMEIERIGDGFAEA